MTFPCIILGERFDTQAGLAAALTRIGVSVAVRRTGDHSGHSSHDR